MPRSLIEVMNAVEIIDLGDIDDKLKEDPKCVFRMIRVLVVGCVQLFCVDELLYYVVDDGVEFLLGICALTGAIPVDILHLHIV
jgi:hypothetical protein